MPKKANNQMHLLTKEDNIFNISLGDMNTYTISSM